MRDTGHPGPHFDGWTTFDTFAGDPYPDVRNACHALSRLLDRPGHPAHAAVRLTQCRRLFERIDAYVRRFPASPDGWGASRYDPPGELAATAAYHALSTCLAPARDVVAAWRALGGAREEWEVLRGAVRAGSWPRPWTGGDDPR